MILTILALVTATQALMIYETSCVEEYCQHNLMLHAQRFNTRIFSTKEQDGLLTTISQTAPPPQIAQLEVFGYTVANNKPIKFSNFTLYEDKTPEFEKLYLYIRLTSNEIEDPTKCKYVTIDNYYIIRECILMLKYTSPTQNEALATNTYKVTIKKPRHDNVDYLIESNKMYEGGCQCTIIEELQYRATVYKGEECREELTADTKVTYGDYLCIGVFGIDSTSAFSRFEVTKLETTYTSQGYGDKTIDMLNIAKVSCSLDGTCVNRQVYAKVQMIFVGKLKIRMVVTMVDAGRRLSDGSLEEADLPKGFNVTLPDEYDVTDPNNLFDREAHLANEKAEQEKLEGNGDGNNNGGGNGNGNGNGDGNNNGNGNPVTPDPKPSSASSLVVSFVSFLTLLLVI